MMGHRMFFLRLFALMFAMKLIVALSEIKADIQMINPADYEEIKKTDSLSAYELSCIDFKKEQCVLKGFTEYNYYYQIADSEPRTISCISDDINSVNKCDKQGFLIPLDFKDIPVVPVLALMNKRHLEVGQKYFYEKSKEEDTYYIQPDNKISTGIVAKHSVRLTGDCSISEVSLIKPYQVVLSSGEKLIGYAIKKIGEQKDVVVNRLNAKITVQLVPDQLDGNHVLLCGDKSSLLPKIDVTTRNCITKFKNSSYMQTICSKFKIFRVLIVMIILLFPITWLLWKTKPSLFLWYDLLSLIMFPLLYLVNYLWMKNPLKCKSCGGFYFLSHKCSKRCLCNQAKNSPSHIKNCLLYNQPSMSKYHFFQLICNSKPSEYTVIWITKFVIGFIILSFMPTTLASEKMITCVNECQAIVGCNLYLPHYFQSCNSDLANEICECLITKDNIKETVKGRNGKTISELTTSNDCVEDVSTCVQKKDIGTALELIACRHGCKFYNILSTKPLTGHDVSYDGKEYIKMTMSNLYSLRRLRSNSIDDMADAKKIENNLMTDINRYDTTDHNDIIPETQMSRKSLIYETKIDDKYRYLIEVDIKSKTGYIYNLNEAKNSNSKQFIVYMHSVGVEYELKYLYTTAPVSTTNTDFLATCTGDCAKCRTERGSANNHLDSFQAFCIEPTSYWGCEEFGCLAINEGAICGSCRNVFDLSQSMEIFEVVRSDVVSDVCIKGFSGYECKTYTDRVPFTTDNMQINMNIDLHNDGISIGTKIACDKNGFCYKGSIANPYDSALVFGHPQLNRDGKPLFFQAKIPSNSIRWSCVAIGPKKVDISSCGYLTYHQKTGLVSLNENAFKTRNLNTIYLEKDFAVGKLTIILDLPQQLFKTITKKPNLSQNNGKCTGCLQCNGGLECFVSVMSDVSFSSKFYWPTCTFKNNDIHFMKGKNELTFQVFCNNDPTKFALSIYPEDDKEFSVDLHIDNLLIRDQETVIDHNDEAADQEQKHHSDTSNYNFWDWIKSPFNWIASFFGNFFDTVRTILVIITICVFVWLLSLASEIWKDYYNEKIKKKQIGREKRTQDSFEMKEISELDEREDLLKSMSNKERMDYFLKNEKPSSRKTPPKDINRYM
nr:glycoprotein precursor Gn/Gc [Pterostylis blotch virus]